MEEDPCKQRKQYYFQRTKQLLPAASVCHVGMRVLGLPDCLNFQEVLDILIFCAIS